MISAEEILKLNKDDLPEASKTLDKNDLPQVIEWLAEKDDKIRYQAFLMLQNRSLHSDDIYSFWEVFQNKLRSDNSYQRSIGLMLIADNVKWDVGNKYDAMIDDYLNLLNDEKPITVRQCIQALMKIVPYKTSLHLKIAASLMALDISSIKETMQKSVLLDVLQVLIEIRKYQPIDTIESYILKALSGGRIDKKTKKEIEERMGK